MYNTIRRSKNIGYEQIRNLSLILLPRLAVLRLAPLHVPDGAVGDHACEEGRVEPGQGAVEAGDEAPCQCEEEVTGVVDLAGVFVCEGGGLLVGLWEGGGGEWGKGGAYTSHRPELSRPCWF